MNEEKRPYISYLLRLWQVKEKGKLVWRASVECPHTGQLTGFTKLSELWRFLQQQTATSLQIEAEGGKGEKGGVR